MTEETAERPVLTLKQASVFLGMDRRDIVAHALRGVIPGRKIGSQWRFLRRCLVRYAGNNGRDLAQHKVYFVQAGATGPIKIGFASDVRRRVWSLQNGSPVELRLLGAVPGGPQIEAQLHHRFAHLRVRGEWFQPNPELLAAIAAFCAPKGSGS